jgi:LysR family glycine cleavage system transcriptional activator
MVCRHEFLLWGAVAKSLPPLNPLAVFDTVSRLGSFTLAAAELCVSQSAVSRQVAVLEGFLGVRLFRREPQGVTLSPEGKAYQAEVAPSFARIVAATDALRSANRQGPLRLRVYATFAVKWLIARLPRFHAQHPAIKVQLSTTAAPVDFTRDAVDMAVQFGDGEWPGLSSQLLMRDVIQPVCSPQLLADHGGHMGLDTLGRHRLLHSHYRRDDWPDWLRSVGQANRLVAGDEFPSSVLTLHAAAEGLGIAIGQMSLLGEDLRSKRLVTPFSQPLERPLGHYVVWSKSNLPDVRGRALARWLSAEAAASC